MKNKTVTIVSIVLVLVAFICFIYIFATGIISKNTTSQANKEENITEQPTETETRTEREQNVNLKSRIALPLRELVKYSEIYSNSIINELDANGLSDDAKLLIALDKIYRVSDYNQYLRYSDEYSSTYILPDEMDIVLNNTFTYPTVKNKNVSDILSYDENTSSYIVIPRGFPTGSIEYTYEVPFKITMFSDRIEMLFYRLYATKTISMQETQSTQKVDLFYDKAKTSYAISIENDPDFTDNTELDYLLKKVEDGAINKSYLEQVKYTFEPNGEEYKLSKFENVNQ